MMLCNTANLLEVLYTTVQLATLGRDVFPRASDAMAESGERSGVADRCFGLLHDVPEDVNSKGALSLSLSLSLSHTHTHTHTHRD